MDDNIRKTKELLESAIKSINISKDKFVNNGNDKEYSISLDIELYIKSALRTINSNYRD